MIRNAGNLVLERCRLTDNDGTLIRNDAVLSVIDCVIEDNRGLVIDDRGSQASLDRTVIRRNSGTLETDGDGSRPRIVRSEISNNDSGIYGCPDVRSSWTR